MEASQFSDAQKAFIWEQRADGVPVAKICRPAGIGQATYLSWKKKYEGLPKLRAFIEHVKARLPEAPVMDDDQC